MKDFVYLVQSEEGLPEQYGDLESANSDCICLTWKNQAEGCIYYPSSTWTEGRNRLLLEAKQREQYQYYIFLDDDIVFTEGSFRLMEQYLLKYEPAVATPFYSWHPDPRLEFEAHTVYSFDAIFNAFHRDLITDGVVLPYYDGFDKSTWWFSQLCVIHLASILYPDHVLKFNRIVVDNATHRDYPRNQSSQFAVFEDWIRSNVFIESSKLFKRYFRSHPGIKREEQYRLPYPKPETYRLSQGLLAETLNLDSEYWARIRSLAEESPGRCRAHKDSPFPSTSKVGPA